VGGGVGAGRGGTSSSRFSTRTTSTSTSTTKTTILALFLLVIRFWNDAYQHRHEIWNKLKNPKEIWALLTSHQSSIWKRIVMMYPFQGDENEGTVRRSESVNHHHNNHNFGDLERTISINEIKSPSIPAIRSAVVVTQTSAERIQENLHSIQAVLQYWFGQYNTETSQKMLWMIAASSIDHRRKVDAEITSDFESLLYELSSSTTRTSPLLPCRWVEWCEDPDGLYGCRGKIAAIIVLDQFSRHIIRHYETLAAEKATTVSVDDDIGRNGMVTNSRQQFHGETLDQRALETAKLFVRDHAHEIKCGSNLIPIPMYIFSLMPFRHASTIESIQYVQTCVEEGATSVSQTDAMVGRFRKATNRRMAVLQDEARRTGGMMTTSIRSISSGGATNKNSIDHTQQQQQQQSGTNAFSDEDILETFPFDADLTAALQHPIHKTIVAFLMERGIHPISSSSISSSLRGYEDNNSNNNSRSGQPPSSSSSGSYSSCCSASVIVSLSGGVDSMVIASVLAHLQKSCGYPHLNVIAVHIDYGNRPESGAEADFVRRYCEGTLNIQFFCRRIDEVMRGVTARDDYERIAREIRYSSYKDAIAVARRDTSTTSLIGRPTDNGNHSHDDGDDNDSTTPLPEIGVMLGHHRGDLRENVLSNAHKGCGPLDLSGMTAISKNDGVIIYRPLLLLEKSFILEYAHKFGIPYFKDTTPHWSTRGKLRNKLLPLLEEIYGDGSMNNLSNLAVESDECKALLQQSTIGPFMDSIVRTPMGIIMDTIPWKGQPVFFWKFVLREALHSASLGMFSDKSVVSFLDRVRAKHVKDAWLQCRKDYGVYLQEDGKVFVFYPTSFPWNKKDQYNAQGNGT
jgi:tRNA(Ile)-lysidine synthase TilS/MesJ/uncharacterized protein (DUF924 family)